MQEKDYEKPIDNNKFVFRFICLIKNGSNLLRTTTPGTGVFQY